MRGEPRPKEMKIKQEKGESAGFKGINSRKGEVAGAGPEKGREGRGKDAYVKIGMSKDMHGHAKGGHPTRRAEEMKGY